jgi:hypothetical protein
MSAINTYAIFLRKRREMNTYNKVGREGVGSNRETPLRSMRSMTPSRSFKRASAWYDLNLASKR